MIAKHEELTKAIENYNRKFKDEEQYLDWYEVIDTIDDLSDLKEVQDAINQINAEAEKIVKP